MYRVLPKDFKRDPKIEVVRKTTKSDGAIAVSGGKDLKQTQHYPDDYGKALFDQWHKHRWENRVNTQFEEDEASVCSGDEEVVDLWPDAGLQHLCSEHGIPLNRMPF